MASCLGHIVDEFDRRLGAQRKQYDRFESDRSLTIERAQSAKRRQEEESRVAREAASQDSIALGANQPVSPPRDKRRHLPRPPVYSGYVPYDPNVAEIHSPYFAPSLRSVYNPDLGGYRW